MLTEINNKYAPIVGTVNKIENLMGGYEKKSKLQYGCITNLAVAVLLFATKELMDMFVQDDSYIDSICIKRMILFTGLFCCTQALCKGMKAYRLEESLKKIE